MEGTTMRMTLDGVLNYMTNFSDKICKREQCLMNSETKHMHQTLFWFYFGSVSRVYLLFGEETCEKEKQKENRLEPFARLSW